MAKLRTILIEVEDHGGIDPISRRLQRVGKAMRKEGLKFVRAVDPARVNKGEDTPADPAHPETEGEQTP